MQTVRLSGISAQDRECAETIARKAGVNLRECYQCGKCSAGCPMAEGMDLTPQQIMHALQTGQVNKALNARGPWICAQCMTCSARCPQEIDICSIMREVRRESHAQGRRAVPESDVFETAFINGVRKNGRSNEQYLAAAYNLKSGHLMQDMTNAPLMMSKGLIGVKKNTVKNKQAVSDLVRKCSGGKGGE